MGDTEKLNEIIDRIALQIVDVDERWVNEKDAIIDVDNKIITNRPYAFGHRGLARELSVMLNQDWKGGEYPAISHTGTETLPVSVSVHDPDLCPRFTALVIKGVKIGPSPDFLKYAVESLGLRSINNLVDITNMIMLDTAQPVHAYDYHKVKNGLFIIRRAKKGEKVVTLDGVERTLDDSMLLITDPEKVIGIGGVMGAGNSEIDDATTDIVLEVASFDPKNIRQTARTLRHRTDAVTRFEKGPDPSNIPNVMAFMADLVVHVCGGEVASEFIDVNEFESRKSNTSNLKYYPSTINFDPKRVDKLLGFGIKEAFIERVLNGFGITIDKKSDDSWNITIPAYRPDLKEAADIVEDIGRMYGYQNIPSVTPVNQLIAPPLNKKVDVLRKIRTSLTASGLDEVLTFSFLSQKDVDVFGLEDAIQVINPLSEEYKYLRKTVTPSLTKVIQENVKYFDKFGIFEISRAFLPKAGNKKTYSEDHGESQQPEEIEVVSLTFYSKDEKEKSIYTVKGALQNLFDELQIINYSFGRDGEVFLNNENIGTINLLNQEILKEYDIDYPVSYAEIKLLPLLNEYKDTRLFRPYSKFQGTKLDYSVLVPMDLPVEEVLMRIPELELIQNKEIFDIYRDSARLGDKKSVSVRIYLQKIEGNLIDEEITQAGLEIEKGLKQIKDLEIRGGGVENNEKTSKVASTETKRVKDVETQTVANDTKNKIVIGKITKIDKHPNADRLVICKVDVGAAKPENTLFPDLLQIVTGAPNIVVDRPLDVYVPVALPGAVVTSHKDGSTITIKVGKLRGEISEGMLCSQDELGVPVDMDGIWILEGEKFEGKQGEVFEY